MTQYAMSYEDAQPTQSNVSEPANDNQTFRGSDFRPPRGLRVPSIIKTALGFCAGAGALFACEMYAPEGLRPSTFVGTYEARIAAATKAAELQQQAQFDAWASGVKLAAEQQAEQYKAVTQGVLQNYTATYDQAKIYAQAAAEVQGRLTASIIAQKQGEQGSDIGIINLARIWGQIGDVFIPGSGEQARDYADQRSATLSKELIEAARIGTHADVSGWDVNIAQPADVAAALRSIKPLEIQAPPSIGEKRAIIAQSLK